MNANRPLPACVLDQLRCPPAYGNAMKGRSKAGGEQIKGRRPKTSEPKRRNVPKTASRPHSTLAAGKTEVARLTRELCEERRQRTAIGSPKPAEWITRRPQPPIRCDFDQCHQPLS